MLKFKCAAVTCNQIPFIHEMLQKKKIWIQFREYNIKNTDCKEILTTGLIYQRNIHYTVYI